MNRSNILITFIGQLLANIGLKVLHQKPFSVNLSVLMCEVHVICEEQSVSHVSCLQKSNIELNVTQFIAMNCVQKFTSSGSDENFSNRQINKQIDIPVRKCLYICVSVCVSVCILTLSTEFGILLTRKRVTNYTARNALKQLSLWVCIQEY